MVKDKLPIDYYLEEIIEAKPKAPDRRKRERIKAAKLKRRTKSFLRVLKGGKKT